MVYRFSLMRADYLAVMRLSVSASQSWFSARLSGDQDQTPELTEYRFALKFSFDTDAPSNRVQESET
jgi:hypothetical protein